MFVRPATRAGTILAVPISSHPTVVPRGRGRTPARRYTTPIAGERWTTPANGITAVRTAGAVGLATAALARGSVRLLLIGYLVYWVLGIADGTVARRLGHETRLGAVFDITADRASSLLCAAALVMLRPGLAVPLGVYVVEFAVVDTMLSLGFLAFPVKGPNDMHLVDIILWRWNWSPPAKAVNTASIVLLCLLGHPVLASVCALAVLALKLWSCQRLRVALIRAEVSPP